MLTASKVQMNMETQAPSPRHRAPVSGNPATYHYLVDSILHFPGPQAFMNLMAEAGFRNPEHHYLTFGITCFYIGGTGAEEQTGA